MDIHVTIDVFDDLYFGRSDWDEGLLRQLVNVYADRGVSAVHWIDYGGIDEGGWDAGSYFDPDGKGQRFIRAVPDPLRVVCSEAGRRGLRVWSVLKIHDLALGAPYASFPLGAGPRPPVGLPHVGGVGAWALRWLREHPDVCSRLHPALLAPDTGRPLRTLRLWHESALPPSPLPPFDLWVSRDNGTYRPYNGPCRVTQGIRRRRPPVFVPAPSRRWGPEVEAFCIEFDGLDVAEPFLCLSPRAPCPLANTLAALVEAEDARGVPIPLTLGVAAAQPFGQSGHDWRQAGIAFDTSRRTRLPGRALHYSAGRARFSLADRLSASPNRQSAPGARPAEEYVILGLARGRNAILPGLIDLAHEPARDWLCGRISRALDAGADGVDIRPGSHAESLDWENYGFSEPALAEFRRRHGVDAATQSFDRRAWQDLQGEYFDRFLAQAAAVVRGRGARFGVHIMPVMEGAPDWPEGAAFHNQSWNWRRWIRDGLVDDVTLKGCRIGEPLFDEAVALCARHGRRSFLNNKPGGPDAEASWIELLRQAENAGVSAVNLYESASLVRLTEERRLDVRYPRLWRRVTEPA